MFPVHDPVLIFSIVMLIVLIAPLLAEKIKLPGMIGLLFFGVIIGPHLFGVLERDKTIDLLGTIGLLFIMFQAGLEINLIEVKKDKHYSLIFGFLTFFVPLALGILGAYYLLHMSLLSSVLLASMFSSHTLLTFPIVSKMGLAKKKSVSATIGGTIITDTLAFIILAVAVGASHGNVTLAFWAKLFLFMILYVVVLSFFLPKISGWFFRHFSSESGVEEYVFVIAALFTSAYLSHLAGFEPVIGAFLAGLTLNPLIPEKSILMNRIQFVGNSLFIPFFLISVGMLIDPGNFFKDTLTLKISAVMIIIAILAKWLAADFFSRIVKFRKEERNLIFGMSVNQAAATLAAVLIGYQVGIFNESVLTGTIMMIIATCFLGSLLTAKYSKALVVSGNESIDFSVRKGLERILVPLSNPKTLNELMDLAFLLHPKNSHEPLYPLNVVIEGPNAEEGVIQGEAILTKAVTRANAAQKETVPLTRIDINVAAGILKSVKEHRISKVILGWNDSLSFQANILNSVLEQFIKESNEMVFISRTRHPISITKRIMLIIPPLMTKQNGFINTLDTLIHFALSINAKIIFIADQKSGEDLKVFLAQNPKHLEYDFLFPRQWKTLNEDLRVKIKEDDLLLQLQARQGQLAWRLNFYRMAGKLKQAFPQNNIMVVFPSSNLEVFSMEENRDQGDAWEQKPSLLSWIPPKNFLFNIRDQKVENVFQEIAHNFFPAAEKEINEQLCGVLNEYPAELTEDILLIHIHTYRVSDYQVYVAVNPSGFTHEAITSQPKIVFTLLSPKEKSPQSHLQMLSEIAKLSLNKHFTPAIVQSKKHKDFIKKMREIQQ